MGAMVGQQVVLLRDEWVRQPDTSAHRLFFGRSAGTPPPQRLEFWKPASVVVEAEGFTQHPTDYTPLYGRTTPVAPPSSGAPWYLWQPSRALEPGEDLASRQDHGQFHRFRAGYQTVGQPWQMLWRFKSPQVEPDPYSVRSTDQTILYGRAALVSQQHWWLYRWQVPTPDTDQFYEYRSRDFWSDLQPHRITPTTPVVEPPKGGGGWWQYRKHWRDDECPEDCTREDAERAADEAVRELDAARERIAKARRKPLAQAVVDYVAPEIDVSGALQALRNVEIGLSRIAQEQERQRLEALAEMERLALIERQRRMAALLLLLHEAI